MNVIPELTTALQRYEFHDDLAMAGFTLVIRGCDFYNDYNSTSSASSTTDPLGAKSGGQETILYIPMDQIMNCSNFNLTLRGAEVHSGRDTWQLEYGDLAGNASGGVYPGDPHSTGTFGARARGIDYCMSPSDGPWHDRQDDEWANASNSGISGHGTGGTDRFNTSGLRVAYRGGVEHLDSLGHCSIAWYWENGLSIEPHNGRSFHKPGDWSLRKLNLQPQPFKATEWRQNKKKSLAQAKADQKLFEDCLSVMWPGWCDRTGLPFWFEHDIGQGILERDSFGHLRVDKSEFGTCATVGRVITNMLNRQYDQTCLNRSCGGHCQYAVENIKAETVLLDGACVCTTTKFNPHGGGRHEKVDAGVLIDVTSAGACPSTKVDVGNTGNTATCTWIAPDDLQSCLAGSGTVGVTGYCTDPNYISQFACLNASADWRDLIGNWEFPYLHTTGKDPGHTQCGGCGRGPKIAFYVLDTPAGLSPQDRQNWQIEHADGINQKQPGSVNDNYTFINLPSQITNKFRNFGLYEERSTKYMTPDRTDYLNSLDYWGATGLWPDGEFSSFITDTFLALNTTRNVEYASHTTPVVIKSINHGLRDDDHIMTYGILGHFKANTWTVGEWQEQQWQDKLYTRCTSDGCGDPMWPNAVCPCNDGACTDSNGFDEASCEKIRYSWDIRCVIKGNVDNRWLTKTACEDESGECYKTDLNGQNRVKITDNREITPPPYNAVNCSVYGTVNSQTLKTEWIPYDGINAPKAEWQGGCSNPNYSNKADCLAARPSWTYNNTYGANNKNCSGVIIKGKFPPPADFFVTKKIDNDHVSLYTCDGEPLDGSITKGLDEDCEPVGPMGCWDSRFSFKGIIEECPCNFAYYGIHSGSNRYNVWGRDYDVPTISRKAAVTFKEPNTNAESNCRSHGFCEILRDAFGVVYDENTIMTRDDCEGLAHFYSKITRDIDTGDFSYEYLSGHLVDGDANGNLPKDDEVAPCVTKDDKGKFDLSACWKPFDWTLKKTIIDTQLGTIAGSVDSWEICPSTGHWTIRDMNITNPLVSDPTSRSWRPYWTESYYKTDKGAEDNYVSISQEETCPVCCDHFMPDTITATIDGLAATETFISGSEPRELSGGTEHFDYMVTGSHAVRTFDHTNAYCDFIDANGNHIKVNKTQANCTGPGETWITPRKYVTAHCGMNSCTGKLHDYVETDTIDPRTNPMGTVGGGRLGRVGGGYCCDCGTEVNEGVTHATSCAKCSGALRFKPHKGTDNEWDKASNANKLSDPDIVDHEFGDYSLSIPADPCCSCECDPGQSNLELAQKDYPTIEELVSISDDGCTGTLGNLSCAWVEVAAATFESKAMRACVCDPCTGFPNNRPLRCEPEQMAFPISCRYDAQGNSVTPPVNSSGESYYDNTLATTFAGCPEPNIYAMPTAECWSYKHKTGDGCQGLGTRSVQMDYNGSHWQSAWFPMMGASPKNRTLNDGQSYPEFVGGMSCQNFEIKCPAQWPRGDRHVLTSAVGNPDSDMNCGGCSTREWNGLGTPPIPSPAKDAQLMRLRLGCGGAFQQYHGRDTLLSGDNYQYNHLSLYAEIAKCSYSGCNKLSVTETLQPPCPIFGDNCVNTTDWSARGYCTFDTNAVDPVTGDPASPPVMTDGYCKCPYLRRCTADTATKIYLDKDSCEAEPNSKWNETGILDFHDVYSIKDDGTCNAQILHPSCSLEDCHCLWSHPQDEITCKNKGGKWNEISEPVPYYDDCIRGDWWATVPGWDCGPTLPCTECCEFKPWKHGKPTHFSTAKVGKTYISCASSSMISGMDSRGTPYGILGQNIPKYKTNPNDTISTIGDMSGLNPKVPETFTVYYVEGVQQYNKDRLVVKKNRHGACGWNKGDPVNIGLADRNEAETGSNIGIGFTKASTRDRLSQQPDWPNHPTELAEAIPDGKMRWGIQEDSTITAPFEYMEIVVKDAGRLISRASMHQQKYWRAAERYLSGEPWPYGDKPWPVGHQSNSTAPLHVVDVGELESIGGTSLTVANAVRDGRVGHLPTLANIEDPKKAVFFSEWPKIEVFYPNDDTSNPVPVPNDDYNLSISIASIKNIYDFTSAKCSDPASTTQSSCERIGYCALRTTVLDQYVDKATCEQASADNKWTRTAWWIPTFRYTEFTTERDHDLRAGEKIIINGSQCYKGNCVGADLPSGLTNNMLDKTLCEVVYGGTWEVNLTLSNLQLGTPPLCKMETWYDDTPDTCPDCVKTEEYCEFRSTGARVRFSAAKDASYCTLNDKKVAATGKSNCEALREYQCLVTRGPNKGDKVEEGNCDSPLGSNSGGSNDACWCCPDPNAHVAEGSTQKKYPNCRYKWTVHVGEWTQLTIYDPNFGRKDHCEDGKKCYCANDGVVFPYGSVNGLPKDTDANFADTKAKCDNISDAVWLCGNTNMKWKEEEEFCPECVIDGAHVVGLIGTNGNPHAEPHTAGVSNKFTILNEQIIEPAITDDNGAPIVNPDWNDLINTYAVPWLGHEVIGGSPKNMFKGAEYQAADITATKNRYRCHGCIFWWIVESSRRNIPNKSRIKATIRRLRSGKC